jgi:LmbE family N-acetylglucosaminyl deacetylase
MQSGCVTTIVMTAGDSGTTGTTYLSAREAGNQAAYAYMAGVANKWTEFSAIFGGQPAIVRTLVGAPGIQKVFFRLPDGNMDGSGFSTTGYMSLRMLYFGSISKIVNQPKTATYTLATLKQAIQEIFAARQPSYVRTLDYMSDYDAGDHADHLTVGRITAELAGKYASNATIGGYMVRFLLSFPLFRPSTASCRLLSHYLTRSDDLVLTTRCSPAL